MKTVTVLTSGITGIVAVSLVSAGMAMLSPAAQAASRTYPVTATVNIRSAAKLTASIVGSAAKGSKQTFNCYTTGSSVYGDTAWGRLSNGKGYISHYYTKTGGKTFAKLGLPNCDSVSKASWTYPVTNKVNIRAANNTTSEIVGKAAKGSKQTFDCYLTGTTVFGNSVWGHLANGKGFISDYYINARGKTLAQQGAPRCSSSMVPPGVVVSTPSENEQLLININASSNITTAKKPACYAAAKAMLKEGFAPAFIAGLLANIIYEGKTGQFESSAYANQKKRPDYLKYMDANYDYRAKYSGRYIYDSGMNVQTVNGILATLSKTNWKVGTSRAGFGLGSAQWTFGRSYTLSKLYLEVNGGKATITKDQAIKAEALMFTRELKGNYASVYSNWKKNTAKMTGPEAAKQAGITICKNYEVPAFDTSAARGKLAKSIYTDMIK